MSDQQPDQAETIREIDSLIEHFDVAMLVTESLDGELRSRPLAVAGHDRGTVLYFLSRAEDAKLDEIRRAPEVCVVMQGEGRYLSVSGKARIAAATQLIEEYWSAAARLWFPDGPDDPAARLVIVEPTYAESWDRTGLRRLEFLWEAGKALLRREKAPDESLSGHHRTRLR